MTGDDQLYAEADRLGAHLDRIARQYLDAPSVQVRAWWVEAVRLADRARRMRHESPAVRRFHGLAADADRVRHLLGAELRRRGSLTVPNGGPDDVHAA